MKTKWIYVVLAVLMTTLIFSISQGADKFYYGGFHAQALYRKCPELKDSLRFNIVFAQNLNQGNIDSLSGASLQGIAEQPDINSPTYWSRVSHYTLWEPERYPESYYHLTYDGGSLVSDPSASGGKAMKFMAPGTPRLIQTGPSYPQEFERFTGDTIGIEYTAVFRLKSPDQNPTVMGAPRPYPVCSLKVVGNGQLLAHSVVYDTAFKYLIGYRSFTITYYASQNPIEFQIYWFGNRSLFVDYVKVYDDFGEQLIVDTTHFVANQIKAYISQEWVKTTIPETGDTVVYRWYMRDQPHYIDCYTPYAYIDSLFRSGNTERIRFQTCKGK